MVYVIILTAFTLLLFKSLLLFCILFVCFFGKYDSCIGTIQMSEDPVKAQQSETGQDRYGNRHKQNKDTQKIRGKDRQHQQWRNEEKTSRRLKH